MIPLYSQEEFDAAKNETLLPLKCKNCGKTFYVKKHYVWAAIRGKAIRDFCSTKCQMYLKNPLVKVVCHTCGKEFEKKKIQASKSDKNFCCRSCANKYSSNINKEQKTSNQKIWANSDIGKKKLSEINRNRQNVCIIRRKKNMVEKTCPICKKDFKTNPRTRKIYCSASCWQKVSGGLKEGSSRGKHGWYKGYWCDSSWELAYVIYNLDHGIKFERNKQGFEYEFEGKNHKYYPDFILEDGTYVEIKSVMDDRNKVKIASFPNPINLLRHAEIKPFIDYAISVYGKKFIQLYEKRTIL